MSDARQPLRLVPFRAVTYAPDVELAAVICPPYDVISARALDRFEAADPRNIVHVSVPRPGQRADHEPASGPDDDGQRRYRHAASEFRRWLDAGILQRDPVPALYVYEHLAAGSSAIGLVGGVGLSGPVMPHEDTFPGPVADRAALMKATHAQLEPILLTYDGGGSASDIVDAAAATAPDRQVHVGPDESHRIWRIDDEASLNVIAEDLAERSALIADGHHRFAAYQAVHAEDPTNRRTGYGLALLVDAARHPLELSGIHRSVAGLAFEQAVSAAATGFDVVPLAPGDDIATALDGAGTGAFVIGDDNRRALLRDVRNSLLDDAIPANRPDGWRQLDSGILVDVVLAHLWAVDDADDRVRYHHASADALQAATRTAGVAVVVRPPAVSDVLALAARGAKMPRKSTSFGPKPWTGLLSHDTA